MSRPGSPAPPPIEADHPTAPTPAEASPGLRLRSIGFRAMLVYFVLYTFPFPLSYVPLVGGGIAGGVDTAWKTLAPWAGMPFLPRADDAHLRLRQDPAKPDAFPHPGQPADPLRRILANWARVEVYRGLARVQRLRRARGDHRRPVGVLPAHARPRGRRAHCRTGERGGGQFRVRRAGEALLEPSPAHGARGSAGRSPATARRVRAEPAGARGGPPAAPTAGRTWRARSARCCSLGGLCR